jgi:DNA replication protein DnaC
MSAAFCANAESVLMHRLRRRSSEISCSDWAMARLTADQRRDLMDFVDDRHQRASTILATQIPVERWHDSIGDPTYADAILDRLVHNAYRIELRGDSMRRRNPDLSGDKRSN